ncbi:MAG: glycosyltransferase [Acidimicrobiia bacterium]|nr:glycosyltransferase [Acidimicrobiia bacterium]
MTRLSIHHVVPDIHKEASGPSQSVTGLCGALGELGAEIRLHTLEPAPERDFSFPVSYYPRWSTPARLGVSPDMKNELEHVAMTADVIHFHGLWMMPDVYPGRAIRDTSCSLVMSPRGMLDPWAIGWSHWRKSIFWLLMQGKAVRRADCIHATSHQELVAVRRFGLRQSVAVVPVGIDIPDELGRRDRDNERVLLFLGRLHPKKNVEALLEAWSRVQHRYSDWVVWIVGEGDPHYIRGLKALGVELAAKRVEFPGPAYGSNKAAIYQAADLFVLPTHSENFGISIAEALSYGVPVITTRGAPWPGLETIGCGWWVKIGADPLAQALSESMALGRSELQEMGLRGRQWMAEEYSWSKVGRMMLETYEWLRGGGSSPSWVDRI